MNVKYPQPSASKEIDPANVLSLVAAEPECLVGPGWTMIFVKEDYKLKRLVLRDRTGRAFEIEARICNAGTNYAEPALVVLMPKGTPAWTPPPQPMKPLVADFTPVDKQPTE